MFHGGPLDHNEWTWSGWYGVDFLPDKPFTYWYFRNIKVHLHFISHSRHQHYNDVIKGETASQITSLTIVYSTVYSGGEKKNNIKAPRQWPLCGEFIGQWRIFCTKGQQRGKCFHLMTSSWSRVVEILQHGRLAPVNPNSKYRSCWWLGDARSQGIDRAIIIHSSQTWLRGSKKWWLVSTKQTHISYEWLGFSYRYFDLSVLIKRFYWIITPTTQ